MIRMLTFAVVILSVSVAASIAQAQVQCQSQQQQPQISALDLQLLQRNTPAQLPANAGPTSEQIESGVRDAIDRLLEDGETSSMIRNSIRNRIQNVQASPSDKPCDGACPDGKCDLKKDSLVTVPIKPRVTKKSFSVFLTKFRKSENHLVNNN